ncbi:MAG: hypothetical protein ACFFDS_05055 [Candidatus Thorarchaeota archaeon]
MNKNRILSILLVLFFFNLVLFNASIGAAIFDKSAPSNQINPNQIVQPWDITEKIEVPETMNITNEFLNTLGYHGSISEDKKVRWKISAFERTANFHISEGDKKLKAGDTIFIQIDSDPSKSLTRVHEWCSVYVNDVNARYDSTDLHKLAVFKFLQPLTINITEDGTDYTNNPDGYWGYLDQSEYINHTIWNVQEDVVLYQNTVYSEVSNKTVISLVFDRKTGLLNDMNYEMYYTNSTGHFAGANITLIRLHGWGLRYTTTTWVVWIPIIFVFVGLIAAIQFRVFQKIKVYRESKKLAQRE